MVDIDGHIVLSDFGLTKKGLGSDELTYTICGSIEYMAPEIFQKNGYSYSIDFYSLGAILFEFVQGLPPFYSSNKEKMIENIEQHNKLKFKSNLSESYKNLVEKLLGSFKNLFKL